MWVGGVGVGMWGEGGGAGGGCGEGGGGCGEGGGCWGMARHTLYVRKVFYRTFCNVRHRISP